MPFTRPNPDTPRLNLLLWRVFSTSLSFRSCAVYNDELYVSAGTTTLYVFNKQLALRTITLPLACEFVIANKTAVYAGLRGGAGRGLYASSDGVSFSLIYATTTEPLMGACNDREIFFTTVTTGLNYHYSTDNGASFLTANLDTVSGGNQTATKWLPFANLFCVSRSTSGLKFSPTVTGLLTAGFDARYGAQPISVADSPSKIYVGNTNGNVYSVSPTLTTVVNMPVPYVTASQQVRSLQYANSLIYGNGTTGFFYIKDDIIRPALAPSIQNCQATTEFFGEYLAFSESNSFAFKSLNT